MEKTLKDLLKPPFTIKEEDGEYILHNSDICLFAISFSPYINFSLYPDVNQKLKKAITETVVQALHNEWERQYGEPKRWIKVSANGLYKCEKCISAKFFEEGFFDRHCPACGQRLLPPEETQ